MRWSAAALFLLLAGAAHAQAPLTGTTAPLGSPNVAGDQAAPAAAPSGPAAKHHRRTLEQRFDEANTTHDGHLTEEQARARMPSVARDFAAIDTGHAGYVTLQQIRDYSHAKRAARRAAKAQ